MLGREKQEKVGEVGGSSEGGVRPSEGGSSLSLKGVCGVLSRERTLLSLPSLPYLILQPAMPFEG